MWFSKLKHPDHRDELMFNRTVFHACSPRSDFKFHKTPQSPGRHCYLCARPVTGYNYRNCKDLYLHPSCAKLPIRKREEEVVLELLEKTSKKCYLCGNQKCGTSWSYVSGEVSLHVGCVMEKLIEKLKGAGRGGAKGKEKVVEGKEAGRGGAKGKAKVVEGKEAGRGGAKGKVEGKEAGRGGAKGKAKADEVKASVHDRMPAMKVTREMSKPQTVVDHKGKGKSANLGNYFVKAVKIILTIVVGVLIGDPTTIVIALLTSILGGTVF